MKSLKDLDRIDNEIINMNVDTGSPIFFLNWSTAKQSLEPSDKFSSSKIDTSKTFKPARPISWITKKSQCKTWFS